jgi:hypothetical protein
MKPIFFLSLLLASTTNIFPQTAAYEKWPKYKTEIISCNGKTEVKQSIADSSLRNIQVHRNPEQVVITKDDKYAFIRCFLSNTVEIINISSGEIVKSISIPTPHHLILTNDGTKIIVASLTDKPFPANPPTDDCSQLLIGLDSTSILTTIDISKREVVKTDTIKTLCINRLLQSNADSTIYLQGKEVIEYNLRTSSIRRRWPFSQQIWSSIIDNKNKRIFLTTISSSGEQRLKAIDLLTGDTLSALPYYTNGEGAGATYIGMDTLSNRIFVQGKTQPYSEILIFDAISLNQLPPVDSANMLLDSFLACPSLGSIFVGAGFPENIVELNYLTLERKRTLPLPLYSRWYTLLLNNEKSRIFSFQYGASEDMLSFINPPQYLDITEYDITTGSFSQYKVTDQKYGCSYIRTLAATKDGRYIIATNSPANTISILDLQYAGIDEINNTQVFEIHPNPSSGVVSVSLRKILNSDYSVELYNIMGLLLFKTFKDQSQKTFNVDLSNYVSGQYLLIIKSNDQSYICKLAKI